MWVLSVDAVLTRRVAEFLQMSVHHLTTVIIPTNPFHPINIVLVHKDILLLCVSDSHGTLGPVIVQSRINEVTALSETAHLIRIART